MEKSYFVDVDMTMSCRFCMLAENEQQAKERVSELINSDPYYHARKADAFVGFEITDVNEE